MAKDWHAQGQKDGANNTTSNSPVGVVKAGLGLASQQDLKNLSDYKAGYQNGKDQKK